jgi:hypothetical protein
MSINYPRPHHGSAAEFQVHGFPYVTGSSTTEVGTSVPIKINFPYATQFIQVTNIGANDLFIGFTANGVKGAETVNRLLLPNDAGSNVSPVIPVKCRDIFFLGSGGTTGFTVIAGLTNVKEFPLMTGSDGFDGVG